MFKITRLYSDKNGESHFEDIEMPLNDDGEIGFLSDKIPVKDIIPIMILLRPTGFKSRRNFGAGCRINAP